MVQSDAKTRAHSESFAKLMKRASAVNALQDLAQLIVRQRFDAMIVASDHCLVMDQCIDDRFFGGLHHPREKRVHEIVGNRLHVMWDLIRVRGIWICSRKSDEQIAGAISRNCSRSGKAKRHATRKPLQLVR